MFKVHKSSAVMTYCFLSEADDFKFVLNSAFQYNLSGTLSECQTVWIQIRTDVLSVLIWVQTVYHGYQQTVNYVFVYYIHLLVTRFDCDLQLWRFTFFMKLESNQFGP